MGDAYMQEREPTQEEMTRYYEEQKRIRELQSRRVTFHLTEDDLRSILKLPVDVHFFGAYYNWSTRSFEVGVWGEPFEPVADHCEAPHVYAERAWDPETETLKVSFPNRTENGNE